MRKYIILMLCMYCSSLHAQVAINAGGFSPHSSAMLDITSTNRGLLIPRMTTAQRTAIVSPAKGLMVYDSTSSSLWYYDGSNWGELNLWKSNGSNIYNSNSGNVGIGTSTPNEKLEIHGNLRFTGAALITSPSNFINFPDKVYFENTAITRGGIRDDGGSLILSASNDIVNGPTYLQLNGKYVIDGGDNWLRLNQQGSFTNGIYTPGFMRTDGGLAIGSMGNPGPGNLTLSGVITCLQGNCPTNGLMRLTPNLHLNSGSGNAVIINWDNGTTGNTQTFRVGNGAGSDAFYVLADGNTTTTGNATINGTLNANGGVKLPNYAFGVSIPASSTVSYTWTHNLGYQPVIMISLDQTGGGFLDYVTFSYTHLNNNQLLIYLTNRNTANTATGAVRWIVVN